MVWQQSVSSDHLQETIIFRKHWVVKPSVLLRTNTLLQLILHSAIIQTSIYQFDILSLKGQHINILTIIFTCYLSLQVLYSLSICTSFPCPSLGFCGLLVCLEITLRKRADKGKIFPSKYKDFISCRLPNCKRSHYAKRKVFGNWSPRANPRS